MEKTYLFPAAFKKAGILMFIPFAVLGLNLLFSWWNIEWKMTVFTFAGTDDLFAPASYFKTIHTDIFPTLVIFGLVVSLLMLCFSRERDEDEYVANLRCRTLVIAVIASYVCLLVGNLFIFDIAFLTFLFINMFTVLVLYAIAFNYRLYQFRKSAADEE